MNRLLRRHESLVGASSDNFPESVAAGVPLRLAKLRPPRLRGGLVARPHLIAQMNEGLECGFVLLSAPAGFGKTTLLAEWAEQWSGPLAWLTLDKTDNNPFVFLQYLTAALHEALGEVEAPSPLPLLPSGTAAFEAGFTHLVNHLERLARPLALVLDDYHHVEHPLIHGVLEDWIETLPAHCHVLIAGRSDPPFPLARWRARGRLFELRAPQLAFDERETHLFLTQTMHLQPTPAEVALLHQRTEGWVTGLQLAALGLRNRPEGQPLQMLVSGEHPYFFDYMVEEVLAREPQEVRDFLLRTAILETLSAPLCAAVACPEGGESQAQAMLHYLEHANLFLLPLDGEGRCFRYHPLFAEALCRLLEETHPEDVALLHHRASDWLASQGEIARAIHHALAADAPGRAAQLLAQHGENLMKSGQVSQLLGWLRNLPPTHLREDPRLALLFAWGLALSLELESAADWAQAALEGLQKGALSDDPTSQAKAEGQVWAIRSLIAALRGDGDEAITLARRALALLPPDDAFSRSYLALNQAIRHALAAHFPQAEQALVEAIRLAQAAGNWVVSMIARCHLGEVQAARGRLSQALETFQQALALTADLRGDPLGFQGDLHVEIGEILLKRNDLRGATEYLNRGLALCQSWLPTSIALEGYLHLAHLHQSLGDQEGLRSALERARQMVALTQAQLDDLIVSTYEMRLALLRGEWQAVLGWAQRTGLLEDPQAIDAPAILLVYVHLILARLLLVLAQEERLLEHAQRALLLIQALIPKLEEGDFVEAQIEAHILRARALEMLGERESALHALQCALALAEPEGFRRTFLDEGPDLMTLLGRLLSLLQRGELHSDLPSRAFLEELLETLASSRPLPTPPEGPGQHDSSQNLPPGVLLTPRELEVLRLVAQGYSNGEIALHLCLALNTVKRHLNNIFLKLGVRTRTQAVARARRLGLIE